MSTRYLVVTKQDCPTCRLILPALEELAAGAPLRVLNQDAAGFPEIAAAEVVHDAELDASWQLDVEIVPTLVRYDDDAEVGRTEGWDRAEWRTLTEQPALGEALPPFRPGCGSLTRDPAHEPRLRARHGAGHLNARRLELAALEDEIEACFDRGWSDGLPVVPPTPERVLAMLEGTTRDPAEIVGEVPPDLVACSIEKIAINAVLAGCRPEYLPVVIAAVEAALEPPFCMHGLLATTYFSGPMVVVSGPLAQRIGMNARGNALGQGNRANATIGRALQLVIRNVGGGRPQGVDRAALGNPGKYTFCFAEDEDPAWTSLSADKGFAADESTVTLFAADGMQGIVDQQSRTPESLCGSFAASLRAVCHPKLVQGADAFMVISPEHARVFHDAGWSKARVTEHLHELLTLPGAELVRGAGGIAEGIPEKLGDRTLRKFRDGGLTLVRAGGSAGMFSAIIAGWGASGDIGSSPVTRAIGT
ncbi:MAG TPA: thioredoxin family protein [Pseudomonadales bacterium]|nr:thioredoxin family protein [Pseudomonadales bacterium]